MVIITISLYQKSKQNPHTQGAKADRCKNNMTTREKIQSELEGLGATEIIKSGYGFVYKLNGKMQMRKYSDAEKRAEKKEVTNAIPKKEVVLWTREELEAAYENAIEPRFDRFRTYAKFDKETFCSQRLSKECQPNAYYVATEEKIEVVNDLDKKRQSKIDNYFGKGTYSSNRQCFE